LLLLVAVVQQVVALELVVIVVQLQANHLVVAHLPKQN
jgi:hypothetical protein